MIKSTDLYMVRIINYMLSDLRKNQFLVRDILGDVVSDPLLSERYGEKEVAKFQKFLQKEIQVNIEYTIDLAKLPAIAVRIGGGVEDVSRTGDPVSDGYLNEAVEEPIETVALDGIFATPNFILRDITALDYDKTTGKVTFPDTVSLENVYAGMHLFDEVNQKAYKIVLVDSDTTLYIDPHITDSINFNKMSIRSPHPDKAIHTRRFWFAREQVVLTCIAVDPVEVIYLYQIILYMIGRFRIQLFEGTNFRALTVRYGPIQRMMDDPNIIFGREITLEGSVLHSYIEKTSRPIVGITSKPYIADGPATIDGVWETHTKKQGWAMENDIPKDVKKK